MFAKRKIERPEDGRINPCRIAGGLYFVGTYQASSHIIDTGDGLIMIDTGYDNTRFLVLESLEILGYSVKDIKYIINTHWHGDHTAATAAIAEMSGAKTIIGKNDAEKAKRYFIADIFVETGDVLSLGNTTVEFLETPGHTRGTVSLFFDICENSKVYRAGMFGGAGANTLAHGKFDYDECREDYRASLARLREKKVDVFIGNHTWNNGTAEKLDHLRLTGENQFIDSSLWIRFLDHCEARLDRLIAKEKESGI